MSDEGAFRQLLISSVCEQQLAQQYWFEGRCIDEANVLFMRIDSGNWLRFLFDCGKLFWRIEATPSLLDPAEVTGKYAYPLVDLTGRFLGTDRRAVDVSFYELTGGRGPKISFSGPNTVSVR